MHSECFVPGVLVLYINVCCDSCCGNSADTPCHLLLLQGHSIGGAMAVLLMLMFRHRGVLQPEQISPVYTFGAPAVFCDGALGGWGPLRPSSSPAVRRTAVPW